MSSSENIRRYRKKKKLTQAQLAKSIGVSVITINRIERGVQKVSLDRIFDFAQFFNVSPWDIEENLPIDKKWTDKILQEKAFNQNEISNHSDHSVETNKMVVEKEFLLSDDERDIKMRIMELICFDFAKEELKQVLGYLEGMKSQRLKKTGA